MDVNGLKAKHFDNNEAALTAAEELLAANNAENPEVAQLHPPKLFENPLSCKHWYAPDASGQGPPFQRPT